MTQTEPNSIRTERSILCAILLLFATISIVGITWGLPSRTIDKYLFGGGEPWSGEKIHRLAGAGEKFSPARGADVDVDPLTHEGSPRQPILLTGSEADVAKIYLRYRLYTYQPDEMITMMALAGMSPRELRLDPRLYQYGGLFIYPVGALIGAAGAVGLIDVRSDVVYYLDNPDEFGRFYVVARAYSAVWGLIGLVIVFAIARRLGGSRAGLLAALLFTLMPVVVCLAHEGKPHLPGAVLMLLAVLFAMRHLAHRLEADATQNAGVAQEARTSRNWWLMCVCCGAAVGMVLSSAPIFILIPLVAWLEAGGTASGVGRFVSRTSLGIAAAMGVYLATNPYVAINAFANREVLASNFGNSFAMYEIARIGEGFVRVLELTIEGATLPMVVLGAIALVVALGRKNARIVPIAVPTLMLFVQFVLIGADKPAEYGRFGVFANTALAIGAACVLTRRWTRHGAIVNWIPAGLVAIWIGFLGAAYLRGFHVDATGSGSRVSLAEAVRSDPEYAEFRREPVLGVGAEPAPYCVPPVNFSKVEVLLVGDLIAAMEGVDRVRLAMQAVDRREMGSGVALLDSRKGRVT
ncbi:MAG: glycosyltransferase family 39 protein, partial [Planctomycetes bacterium]|nr:glycosyltransferase family 39 protein [Planctomycetota bacterium]